MIVEGVSHFHPKKQPDRIKKKASI